MAVPISSGHLGCWREMTMLDCQNHTDLALLKVMGISKIFPEPDINTDTAYQYQYLLILSLTPFSLQFC